MKSNKLKQQNGSITLIMVFFTTTILFLLVFADHLNAMKEKAMAQSDVQTEQAFYASQSGLEEAYLKLRTDENYAASPVTVQVEGVSFKVEKTNVVGKSGQLIITGTDQEKIRTVASAYTDAGASIVQNHTAIYHILDQSGSMNDDGDGCTKVVYLSPLSCTSNDGVWGPQPMTSTKEAAKTFIDKLISPYDKIGLVRYGTDAVLGHDISTDYQSVKNSIENLNADNNYWTNIGGALDLATNKLISVTDADVIKVEIILTDGQPNVSPSHPYGCEDDDCYFEGKKYAMNKAEEAKDKKIIIFAIGLGSDVNQDFLKTNIASQEDFYFFAPDTSSLDEIYNKIASIITEYNIGQKSWEEK